MCLMDKFSFKKTLVYMDLRNFCNQLEKRDKNSLKINSLVCEY